MSTELILRPSKSKHIRISLGGFLLAICAASQIHSEPLLGWFGIIFFGGAGVFLLYQLLSNGSQLRLLEDGFEVRSVGRTKFTRWDDVEEFFVTELSQGGLGVMQMVAYNYVQSYEKNQTVRSLSSTIASSEDALPDTYGKKAKDLAALMTEWKHGNFQSF